MKLKDACSLDRNYDKPRQHTKKQRHYFTNGSPWSQSYGFSSSHGRWTIKKAECQRIDGFELWCWRRLWRFPWTAKRSNHWSLEKSWTLIGKTDAEAEAPILCLPDVKSWLIRKDSNPGRDWGQEEKDEMAGWHHWLDGREFKWILGLVIDRESWRAAIHRVASSQTRLSDWLDLLAVQGTLKNLL